MGIFGAVTGFWSGRLLWKTVLVLAAVAVITVVVVHRRAGTPVTGSAISVTRGSIEQIVTVTGSVKPNSDVQLSFQSSGRVGFVGVAIGASVSAGQILASLDSGELQAQLRDAQATVAAQQARLDELVQGPRAEDVRISETQVTQAQQNLQNAYDNVDDVLADALTTADSAIHNKLEGIFNQVGTITFPSYKLTFSCFCDQLDLTVNNQRGDTETALNQWRQDLNGMTALTPAQARVDALQRAAGYLTTASAMLGNLTTVLNHPTVSLPADTAATFRTAVSAARASIVTAQTSVITQQQSIGTLRLAADQASAALAKLLSGSSTQAVAVQRAQVQSAQAQVERIQALIANGTIRSPFAGIVTKQDAKVGQNAAAFAPLITVISGGQFEIEANIPEVDIGKVKIGDKVSLTVDALPGEKLGAHVTFIDPAETVIDGVVNFKVTMRLDLPDDRLKSGLTVNLDIQTLHKDNVLILPQYAIIENDQGTFVKKIIGTAINQVPVQLGIRSPDGMVEIVSGLQDGDSVQNVGLKQ